MLDRHLQFLFSPVGFRDNGYSFLNTFPVKDKSGSNSLFCLYCPPFNSGKNPEFIHFDIHGHIIKQKEIDWILKTEFFNPFVFHHNMSTYIALSINEGGVYIFDTSFQLVKKLADNLWSVKLIAQDIDNNQEDELIFINSRDNKLLVFREGMTSPASMELPLGSISKTIYSLKYEPGQPPLLVVESGNTRYLINYRQNPFYYQRWFIFAGIFLFIYLLILLIARIQRLRLESRMKTEKKITELQLKIVRNQMDPHFTMNAINSVIDAIEREKKEVARENLLRFSKMYRSLVLTADKYKQTLKEEIDFTENYLALEQFRFSNNFTYKFEICESVDISTEVPKMIIQSPVENAVKHGLQKKYGPHFFDNEKTGGELLIKVGKEDRKIIIEIIDNGIGLNATANIEKSSTGKGMEMMEQFFNLYHRITGIRVNSSIINLKDIDGNTIGTEVRIFIFL